MEVIDPNLESEAIRSRCFDAAAAAFADNKMDLATYEKVVGDIVSAGDVGALQVIARGLPAPPDPQEKPSQVVSADHSSIRKAGRWIESPNLSLHANYSMIVLDFTAYRFETTLRLRLDVNCTGSGVRLVVPGDVAVVERLSSNTMSIYRDRRGPGSGPRAIVITGCLSGSSIKVKRKWTIPSTSS